MTDITNKYKTSDGRPLGTPHINDYEQDMSRLRYSFITKDQAHFYRDAVVLDCGGGYGTGADELIKLGALHVDSVDLNPEAIELANKIFANEKISFLCSDWTLLNGPYDIVVAVELVEHLTTEQLDTSLNHWYNILSSGGYLYVTTPRLRGSKDRFPDGSHFTEFTFDEIVDIVTQKGFVLTWSESPENTDSISMALCFKKVSQ